MALGKANRRAARPGRGSRRLLLIAQSEGTDAACADNDNDGVAGLTRLDVLFRDTVLGEHYTAVAEPARGGDIHRRGTHLVRIRLRDPDGSEIEVDGLIKLGRDLPVPRPGR